MQDQTTTGAPPVTVLSASVLIAARTGYRESREDFAVRADVPLRVVEAVEGGSRPAWDLPYATFSALGGAVSVLSPSMCTVFETAAACDLMLTCVMRGDHAFSTDVLADDDTRDLAVGLLRWAVTGEFRLPGYAGCVQVPVLWAWHEECGGWVCPACQRVPVRDRSLRVAATAASSSATRTSPSCAAGHRNWPSPVPRMHGSARRSWPCSEVPGEQRPVLDRARH